MSAAGNKEYYEAAKAKFTAWLNAPENHKNNSTIMSVSIYSNIIKYLNAVQSDHSLKNFERKIEKRVKKHKYQLMSYPTLGLKDILCVPSKGNQVP